MLVKDCMSKPVICCTPWDTVWMTATLMKTHPIGALPVVEATSDPLLEGIITDRDLCCAVVASPKLASAVRVADVMTRVPVSCHPENTLGECQELMRVNQVRRLPVVNEQGRCLGIISLADLARHAPAAEVAATIRAICRPEEHTSNEPNKNYMYCAQLHHSDQIALLNRRREQRSVPEVLL